jgi:hypothetical protein
MVFSDKRWLKSKPVIWAPKSGCNGSIFRKLMGPRLIAMSINPFKHPYNLRKEIELIYEDYRDAIP